MSGFRINSRKHIDGMVGMGLLLPFFFWIIPGLLNSEDVDVNTAYTVILTMFGLIVNAFVMSWFTMVKKVQDIEYRVTLLLLAGGITVASFILGMVAGNIYLAVIGSVIVTYAVIYFRSTQIIRQQSS